MDANERRLHPVAVSLHTRDRQEDYRWLVEVGPGELVSKFKELHRGLIADQDARPASTFILFDQGRRLGLLVANLKTSRQDHLGTHIDDALLLEFTGEDREMVFRLAAGLLAEEAAAIQQQLLHYAEERFRQNEETKKASVEPLDVPAVAPIAAGSADLLMESHVGLRSTVGHQRRVAEMLRYLASTPSAIEHPFVVISTGFVGREQLEQMAVHLRQFIALTRSSSFPEDEEVAIGRSGDENKKPGKPRSRAALVSLGLFGLLGISFLAGWLLLGNRFSTSSDTPSSAASANKSSDSKTKSTDYETKLPGSARKSPEEGPTDKRAELVKGTTAVGLASALRGSGPLQAVSALLAGDTSKGRGQEP